MDIDDRQWRLITRELDHLRESNDRVAERVLKALDERAVVDEKAAGERAAIRRDLEDHASRLDTLRRDVDALQTEAPTVTTPGPSWSQALFNLTTSKEGLTALCLILVIALVLVAGPRFTRDVIHKESAPIVDDDDGTGWNLVASPVDVGVA